MIDGGAGRDYIAGGNGDDVLVGGTGNDRLIGGRGNDRLTGDAEDGTRGRNDRDVFVLHDGTRSGNDVITDFDLNGFFWGESSYDTLRVDFGGLRWSLSSAFDMVRFTWFIEHDGDADTDALLDGSDLIFVFDRNASGEITDSVRLVDVVGTDGLSPFILRLASVDPIMEEDVFTGTQPLFLSNSDASGFVKAQPDAPIVSEVADATDTLGPEWLSWDESPAIANLQNHDRVGTEPGLEWLHWGDMDREEDAVLDTLI